MLQQRAVSLLDVLRRRDRGLGGPAVSRAVLAIVSCGSYRNRQTLASFLQQKNVFRLTFLGFSSCGAHAFVLDDKAQAILLFPLRMHREAPGVSLSLGNQAVWTFVQAGISYPLLENHLTIFSCQNNTCVRNDAPDFVVTLIFPGVYATLDSRYAQADDCLLSYCELRCMYGENETSTFAYNSSASKHHNALYALRLGVAGGSFLGACLFVLNQMHKLKYFFFSQDSGCLLAINGYSEVHAAMNYRDTSAVMQSPLGTNVFGNRWYIAEPLAEDSAVLEVTFDAENFLKEYFRRYLHWCSLADVREYEVRCAGLCDRHFDLLQVVSYARSQPTAEDPHVVAYSAVLISFSPFYGFVVMLKMCDLVGFCVRHKAHFASFKGGAPGAISNPGFLTTATDFYVHMLRRQPWCEHSQSCVSRCSKALDISVNEIEHPALPVTIYNEEYGQDVDHTNDYRTLLVHENNYNYQYDYDIVDIITTMNE